MKKKILFAGESWVSYSRHIKGFDSFFTSLYEEGVEWVRAAIEEAGYEFVYISNTYAAEQFPKTKEELSQYAGVFLSDIGSNTLLLSNQCFKDGQRGVNRCELIRDYVKDGGSFCMIGGYMSFTGIEAKARYGQTALAEIIPVKMLDMDDRAECPQGIIPVITKKEHPIFKGIVGEWPYLLGYNKTIPIENTEVLATIGNDPFVVVGEFEKGRSAIFSSDCSPHWGSPSFVSWPYYKVFWKNLVDWMTEK